MIQIRIAAIVSVQKSSLSSADRINKMNDHVPGRNISQNSFDKTALTALNQNAKGVNKVPCRYKGVTCVFIEI